MDPMDTAQLVSTVCPRINDLGWAFYFTDETKAVGASLDLDLFRFYFLGRGGVLGDTDAGVVASAFGYFEPSLVAHMWDSAKERCDPRKAAEAFMGCSADLGRERFAEVDGPVLEGFCDAAGAVNDAASPLGLALYSGFKDFSLVADAPGRAMQLVTVLREFRGSAHLVSVVASGLTPKTAHYLKRPNDMGMFGYSDGDVPAVDENDRANHSDAERLTDLIVSPAYAVLDDSQRCALVSGVDAIGKALGK